MNKSVTWLLAALLMTLLYQNCGSQESGSEGGQASTGLDTSTIDSVIAYEKNLHEFVSTNCGGCHRSQSAPLFVDDRVQTAHDLIISFGLVNLASPADSRMVLTVARGHQSVPPDFRDFLIDFIDEWGDDLRRAGRDNNNGGSGPTVPEPIVDPTFQSIFRNIFVPKCNKCHSPDGIRPREDYTSYQRTIATGRVVPGNANASRLYRSCEEGSMPDDIPPLNSQQLGALRDWINDGAQNN